MPLTPVGLESWLLVLRPFALSFIGIAGLTVIVHRFWVTGDVSLPVFAAFAGLLGLNALQIGKG